MMHEPGRKRKAALDGGASKAAGGAAQMTGTVDTVSFAVSIVAKNSSPVKPVYVQQTYITGHGTFLLPQGGRLAQHREVTP